MAKNKQPTTDMPGSERQPGFNVLPDDLMSDIDRRELAANEYLDSTGHLPFSSNPSGQSEHDPYAVLTSAPTLASVPCPGMRHAPQLVTPTPYQPPADTQHVLPSMTDARVRGLYADHPDNAAKYRADADPIEVETLELLDRIYYGGLLMPYAADAREQLCRIAGLLRAKVKNTPES